jgi:hypothetical protein
VLEVRHVFDGGIMSAKVELLADGNKQCWIKVSPKMCSPLIQDASCLQISAVET